MSEAAGQKARSTECCLSCKPEPSCCGRDVISAMSLTSMGKGCPCLRSSRALHELPLPWQRRAGAGTPLQSAAPPCPAWEVWGRGPAREPLLQVEGLIQAFKV